MLLKARADGRDMRSDKTAMFTAPMVQEQATWTGFDVLRVVPTGQPGRCGASSSQARAFEGWAAPFCHGWERFTPDPAWPIPNHSSVE